MASTLFAIAMLLGFGLCKSFAETADTNAVAAMSSGTSVTNATVELTAEQLKSIKVGPLETFPFPVEREAFGSVGFDKDPSEIQAESTLLGAAATAEVASNELVRAKALYETNGVAQRELEQATSDDQSAQSALRSARYAVLALGVTAQEIDQLLAAKRIDATPASTNGSKWVLANAIESDAPYLRVGDPVRVTFAAFPAREFDGKIARIYTTVDPNLHRQPFRCEVEDSANELHVGMLATVTVRISKPVESLAIPLNGVVREGDGTMTAWVTADNKHFTQRIVKTGRREDGRVQVLNGLQGDKQVVTDGAIFLDNMVNAMPSD